MTAVTQKRLAISAALAVLAVFVVANAHLFTVAFQSHPDCAAISPDRAPARNMC